MGKTSSKTHPHVQCHGGRGQGELHSTVHYYHNMAVILACVVGGPRSVCIELVPEARILARPALVPGRAACGPQLLRFVGLPLPPSSLSMSPHRIPRPRAQLVWSCLVWPCLAIATPQAPSRRHHWAGGIPPRPRRVSRPPTPLLRRTAAADGVFFLRRAPAKRGRLLDFPSPENGECFSTHVDERRATATSRAVSARDGSSNTDHRDWLAVAVAALLTA